MENFESSQVNSVLLMLRVVWASISPSFNEIIANILTFFFGVEN